MVIRIYGASILRLP